MDNDEAKNQADLEWEQRTLCIDESCIGVIGPDGRCKECGLAFDGEQPEEVQTEPDSADPEDAEAGFEDFEEDEEAVEDETVKNQTDLEWEQRTLCIDESCIGVIGPDGRCKECGLPYKKD